jgi:hypothetical protein
MKNLNDKEKVGYVILIAGLCVMGYAIGSVIIVFNGGVVPLELLHSENKKIDTINQTNQTINLGEIIEPLFPMFNALIWVVIALLLVVAGGKVARIGIKMMKVSIPDEVKIIRNEKDYKKETEKIKMDANKNEEELKKS